EFNYKEGKRYGLQQEYYKNGKKKQYGDLVNGNGILTEWHEDGKIAQLSTYKNGRLNGVQKEFSSIFENELISELNYKDGKLDGRANYRGRLIGNYSNGKFNGIQIVSDFVNEFEVLFSMDTFQIIIKSKKHINKYEPGEKKMEHVFGLYNKNYLQGIESSYAKKDTNFYLQSQGKIIRTSLNFTEDEVVHYINACGWHRREDFILEEVKKKWPDYVFCKISKDSIWKTWHFNGQLESTGSYTDNLQNGVWKTWFDNGVSETEGSYRLGIKEGNWKSWHSNGQLASIGSYISEQKNGSWKLYNSKGQIISDENYSNGKKNGLFTKYYENGNLSSKENYINDIKHGIWKKYDENGIVTQEESYLNGLKDGIWITRHSNGIKSSVVTYKDDKIIGERKNFDEKGNLIKPQPQVVVNYNVNQNNPNQSFQRQRENCITCNGSGKCNGCNKYFNCRYYNANATVGFRIQNRQETKPGYVMCTNCEGSSYSWQYPNNNAEHNIPCHVGRCINGWIECSKCSTSNRGACTECNGRGYQE
ncbi:MAG: toxin-antitoxin system YwqK family antitoxin, partial [Bacteroidota bacterium]